MPTVLSTKILAKHQKELFLNSGLGLVEYNAIRIQPKDFSVQKKVGNAIFSSKNAVKAVSAKNIEIQKCFCVGEKTSALALEKGYEVAKTAENAAELASCLIENHKHLQFHFFSGTRRRDELPDLLSENKVNFEEIEVYETGLNFSKFNRLFDGIMFFSPSGIKSFIAENQQRPMAFCIGSTTGDEAKKNNFQVMLAGKTSIENVIARTVNYFKN